VSELVALLGHPVAHSLSPRMQNAAFEAAGLDWTYVALDVGPDRVADALRALDVLGFAGANVTAPHKAEVARLVGSELASVNTLVGLVGYSTDAAILDGLPAERPVVLGDGGAAAAFVHALPHARVFSRRTVWPPEVADADLVVNATAARDEVLVELRQGQTLVDLPYPRTATATAAEAAGAHVLDGLEVLVAQGAGSFELWTGLAAPVAVMRRAIGLPEMRPTR
jgi:shikimate dehydrogenase